MTILHAKTVTIGDMTGTVTVFGSTGGTETVAATDLVRPSDFNSAHVQEFTLSGNTAGNSTVSGTNVIWQGGNNVTLSGTGSTIVVQAGGGAGEVQNYFNPQDGYVQVAGQQGNASLHMQPMKAPDVTFDRIVFPMQLTNATNTTGSMTVSMAIGFYTRNDSTFSMYHSASGSVAITYSGTVNNSTYSGLRNFTIGNSSSLPAGQYYVGIWSRTTTGDANGTANQYLASQVNSNFAGYYGSAVSATMQYTRGLGHYTATFSTALPNSVAISQLNGTASIVLRRPVFYMVNGTF